MTDYLAVAKALYPVEEDEPDRDFPWSIYNYQPIINHIGIPVVQVDDHDYQGDSRVLYADMGKGVGYLNFGWGSCSGCDALQACDSYEELAKLIEGLETSVKWCSKDEMLKYFKEHDWEGDYSWYEAARQLHRHHFHPRHRGLLSGRETTFIRRIVGVQVLGDIHNVDPVLGYALRRQSQGAPQRG